MRHIVMSTSDYSDHKPTNQETDAVILAPVAQALQDNNLTLDRLAKKIDKLVDCTRPVSTDKDGKAVVTPDNPSQIKAVDMALKLQQAYPAEQHDIKILGETEMTLAVLVFRQEADKGINKPDKTKTPENITPCNDKEKTTPPTGGRPDKTDSVLPSK